MIMSLSKWVKGCQQHGLGEPRLRSAGTWPDTKNHQARARNKTTKWLNFSHSAFTDLV